MLQQHTPEVPRLFNPIEWAWRYSTSHRVEGGHATSLVPRKTDPKTARFEDSFDVSEAEKATVVKAAAKGKG